MSYHSIFRLLWVQVIPQFHTNYKESRSPRDLLAVDTTGRKRKVPETSIQSASSPLLLTSRPNGTRCYDLAYKDQNITRVGVETRNRYYIVTCGPDVAPSPRAPHPRYPSSCGLVHYGSASHDCGGALRQQASAAWFRVPM